MKLTFALAIVIGLTDTLSYPTIHSLAIDDTTVYFLRSVHYSSECYSSERVCQ